MSTVTTRARCATLVLALAAVTLGDAAATPLHRQNSTTTVNNIPQPKYSYILMTSLRSIQILSNESYYSVNFTD